METACRGKSRQSRARSSMDRATGFYPVGWGFESLRAHFHEALCPHWTTFLIQKAMCVTFLDSPLPAVRVRAHDTWLPRQ